MEISSFWRRTNRISKRFSRERKSHGNSGRRRRERMKKFWKERLAKLAKLLEEK
jgi:hypothetical protein